MADKRDYYQVLGVDKKATLDDVKKAYKKLAIKFHPDRNNGDAEAVERFKEAAEAYDVLSDPDKRARYDRFGHAGVSGAGRGGTAGFSDLGDIFDAFGDLFEGFGIFGAGSDSRRRSGPGGGPVRGAHVEAQVTLDLVEAATSCVKEVRVHRTKVCARCTGNGCEPGSKPEHCDYCGGHGQVIQSQGFFRVQTTCPACKGAGQVIRERCTTCRGTGQEPEEATVKVRIPAGLDNGIKVREPGEGSAGMNGGPRGDLFVEIHVREHKLFRRDGKDLWCEVPISYTQAALGTTVEIPTLNGREELAIPPGTQPGEVIRLRSKGMPDFRGGRHGDLHVEVKVVVPKKLTAEHESLLRQLAEREQSEVHPHQKSWFERMKEFFTGETEE
jgi:molecular chaperone DnaJ